MRQNDRRHTDKERSRSQLRDHHRHESHSKDRTPPRSRGGRQDRDSDGDFSRRPRRQSPASPRVPDLRHMGRAEYQAMRSRELQEKKDRDGRAERRDRDEPAGPRSRTEQLRRSTRTSSSASDSDRSLRSRSKRGAAGRSHGMGEDGTLETIPASPSSDTGLLAATESEEASASKAKKKKTRSRAKQSASSAEKTKPQATCIAAQLDEEGDECELDAPPAPLQLNGELASTKTGTADQRVEQPTQDLKSGVADADQVVQFSSSQPRPLPASESLAPNPQSPVPPDKEPFLPIADMSGVAELPDSRPSENADPALPPTAETHAEAGSVAQIHNSAADLPGWFAGLPNPPQEALDSRPTSRSASPAFAGENEAAISQGPSPAGQSLPQEVNIPQEVAEESSIPGGDVGSPEGPSEPLAAAPQQEPAAAQSTDNMMMVKDQSQQLDTDAAPQQTGEKPDHSAGQNFCTLKKEYTK